MIDGKISVYQNVWSKINYRRHASLTKPEERIISHKTKITALDPVLLLIVRQISNWFYF